MSAGLGPHDGTTDDHQQERDFAVTEKSVGGAVRRWRLGLLVAFTMVVLTGTGAASVGANPTSPGVATITTFAPDLLHGDNGLPPSDDFPLPYGPVASQVEINGDALDTHEDTQLAFFHGSYYLYGVKYGCGTHIDLTDDAPFCGFSIYKSDDLTNWRLADTYLSDQLQEVCSAYCAHPKVIYSPRLHRYLLFFSSDNGGNYGSDTPNTRWLAESISPAGPWKNLHEPQLMYGTQAGHFDVRVASDGNAYMTELQDKGGQLTDVWIERLNADYTATSGEAFDATNGSYSGAAIFEHGGHWYMTLLTNGRFYGPGDLVYLRADSPSGPWTSPDGSGGTTPATISAGTCGGEGQGLSVLPSSDGPVPIEMADVYTSSPTGSNATLPDRLKHGDWNQALAGQYWAPLSFDAQGRIKPLVCGTSTQIPLAPSAHGAHHGALHQNPEPLRPVQQVDCRVTPTGSLQQSWTVPRGAGLRSIRVPVFQRVYMTSPAYLPKVQPAMAVNAPLAAELVSPGRVDRWTIQPSDVRWAPHSVTLRLPKQVRAGGHVMLRFLTQASDGCYGVLVGAVHPVDGVPDPSYGAVENGAPKPAQAVEMLLSVSADD